MTSTRWQSSQRPLFVRTVWVNGRRHAILSRDDPLLQFPRPASSSASSDTSSESSSCCQLEDCLIKLRLALRPDSYQDSFQRSVFPIRHGTIESSECYEHGDCEEECEGQSTRLPLLGRYPEVFTLDAASPYLPEPQLNPLSERVLQWLDLSGSRPTTTLPAPVRERRKNLTVDIRKTHTSRRRELNTRSMSVDVLANLKLSARSKVTHVKHMLKGIETPPICSSPEKPESARSGYEEPPVVQTFEPPRLLRPTGWPHPSSNTRPQLHIFMPPLADEPSSDAEGL